MSLKQAHSEVPLLKKGQSLEVMGKTDVLRNAETITTLRGLKYDSELAWTKPIILE